MAHAACGLCPMLYDVRSAASAGAKSDEPSLGVKNGLLADCGTNSCSSSQDDYAGGGGCFAEPWEYDESIDRAFSSILGKMESVKGPGESLAIVTVDNNPDYKYLRAAYSSIGDVVDDVELYLPGDTFL